jgi:hypothetical protein
MSNFLKISVLSLLLGAGASLPVAAGSISNVSISNYQDVRLSGGVLGPSGILDSHYSGQIILATGEGPLGVWCVDLLHDIYLGGSYTYTQMPLTTNNLRDSGVLNGAQSPYQSLTASQIQGISELAALGNAVLRSHPVGASPFVPDALYASDLAKVSSADLARFNANLAAFSAAIQASIWNLEYGTTASGSADFLADMALISANMDKFSNIGGFVLDVSGNAQRQFVSAIPEPGSLGLLGVGVISLGVARRRKSRTAVPAA